MLRMSPQNNYQCIKTTEFAKVFQKLDKYTQRIIDDAILETLFQNPYESKRLLSPKFKGKRSLRKGKFRIIFAICEECQKNHEDRINNCCGCSKKFSENNVMIFWCGHRKHVYDD